LAAVAPPPSGNEGGERETVPPMAVTRNMRSSTCEKVGDRELACGMDIILHVHIIRVYVCI
jgi:hypothetical protein